MVVFCNDLNNENFKHIPCLLKQFMNSTNFKEKPHDMKLTITKYVKNNKNKRI